MGFKGGAAAGNLEWDLPLQIFSGKIGVDYNLKTEFW